MKLTFILPIFYLSLVIKIKDNNIQQGTSMTWDSEHLDLNVNAVVTKQTSPT